MNLIEKNAFLEEAISIGRSIAQNRYLDENGCFWRNKGNTIDGGISEEANVDLYSGNSGIALFLIELYTTTKEPIFLEISIDALNWAYIKVLSEPQINLSFYTGVFGLAYAYGKLFQISNNPEYLDRALHIAKFFSVNIIEGPKDDLIVGFPSCILCMLYLHELTKEDFILNKINEFIPFLFKLIRRGDWGIYWNRQGNEIKGLCGFAHGASGLAFIFLELGHYFRNETFYWFAKQAMLYEEKFYNKKTQNWSDLRKEMSGKLMVEEYLNAYRRQDLGFFTKSAEMVAWCHGAPGIGLVRLRAFELHLEGNFREEALAAINKTVEYFSASCSLKINSTFSICHGFGGNALLLINAAKVFQNSFYLEEAWKVGLASIEHRKANNYYKSGFPRAIGENFSLFMGNAGIGHFYLSLYLDKLNSIVAPSISSQLDLPIPAYLTFLNINLMDAKKVIEEKDYLTTIEFLNRLNQLSIIEEFFLQDSPNENDRLAFYHYIKKVASTEFSHSAELIEIVDLECKKVLLDTEIFSYAYYNTRELSQNRILNYIDFNNYDFLNTLKVVFNPDASIIKTNWDWKDYLIGQDIIPGKLSEDDRLIFLKTSKGIIEITLNQMSNLLVNSFQIEKPIKEGVSSVVKSFEFLPEELPMILNLVYEQIKQLLLIRILVLEEFKLPI